MIRASEIFKVGNSVRVSNIKLVSDQMIGVVVGFSADHTNAYVRFDNWCGDSDRVLCFKPINLKHVEGNIMANNNAVVGNYDVAMVKFLNAQPCDKEYAFALFDEEVNVGNLVVVDTCGDFKVAKVTAIIRKENYRGVDVTREVVCKVDPYNYERRKEIKKQKAKLKKQMDELLAKNQELILYQAIAENNPEMAKMLAEYTALSEV